MCKIEVLQSRQVQKQRMNSENEVYDQKSGESMFQVLYLRTRSVPGLWLRQSLSCERGQKGGRNACEMLFIDPGWVRSMREDSGNRSGMADNLRCNHEWKKYEPRSMVFLPKIPESECCEMVMLYSPMYAYVYSLQSLNNYEFALWPHTVLFLITTRLCAAVWTYTWHTCTIL